MMENDNLRIWSPPVQLNLHLLFCTMRPLLTWCMKPLVTHAMNRPLRNKTKKRIILMKRLHGGGTKNWRHARCDSIINETPMKRHWVSLTSSSTLTFSAHWQHSWCPNWTQRWSQKVQCSLSWPWTLGAVESMTLKVIQGFCVASEKKTKTNNNTKTALFLRVLGCVTSHLRYVMVAKDISI